MIGYRYMYYAFRNIPVVCRNHPVRSGVAVVLISLAFAAAYVFSESVLSTEEFDKFAEVPTVVVAAVCCILFLFGQAAGFEEEWTRGRELGEAHKQLSKEISELMRR
jgi:hypothetical protein